MGILTEQEFHSMKFSCQVETSSSLNPVEPAPSKSSPGLNWDIEVQVDQVRLVSEPPVRENIVFAAQTTRASEPPIVGKPISISSSSSSSHTSKKSVSQTTSMSTSMKSSSQSSTTMTSKKSTSSRNVQINVGSKRSVVAVSANSLADERKLSKLMNPRAEGDPAGGLVGVHGEGGHPHQPERGAAGQRGEGQDQFGGPQQARVPRILIVISFFVIVYNFI